MTSGNVGSMTTRQVVMIAALALVLGALVAWLVFRPTNSEPTPNIASATPTTPSENNNAPSPTTGTRLGLVTHVPVTADPAQFATAYALASCSWDATAHTRADMIDNLKRGSSQLRV